MHPYTSVQGALAQTIKHLRNTFPKKFDIEALVKLGSAPKNERTILKALQFLGIIDDKYVKVDKLAETFLIHDEKEFQNSFSKLISNSYSGLFSLYGDKAWELSIDDLISFFRGEDKTSTVTATRQAQTFKTFAAFCGYGEIPLPKGKQVANTKKAPPPKKKTTSKTSRKQSRLTHESNAVPTGDTPGLQEPMAGSNVGLTVRIEINLPVSTDQRTYDMIFKSIRENFIDGK